MFIKISLIRHGKTIGNEQRRYIGVTDEPLSPKGIDGIKAKEYEHKYVVFCSPLKRCVQTAVLIFGEDVIHIVNGLKECNFGDFEGKNYEELKDNVDYQRWIDSNGTIAFPNGEDNMAFRKRCLDAFDKIILNCEDNNYKDIAIVCHGGTIMSILEKYSYPNKEFYDWQVENGHGYSCVYDTDKKQIENIMKLWSE